MTPERWQQIEAIFHEALELDGVERSKFIEQSSEGDGELKIEVEKLLSQFDDASSFIEQPLCDSVKSGVLSALLEETGDDPLVGKVLGNTVSNARLAARCSISALQNYLILKGPQTHCSQPRQPCE